MARRTADRFRSRFSPFCGLLLRVAQVFCAERVLFVGIALMTGLGLLAGVVSAASPPKISQILEKFQPEKFNEYRGKLLIQALSGAGCQEAKLNAGQSIDYRLVLGLDSRGSVVGFAQGSNEQGPITNLARLRGKPEALAVDFALANAGSALGHQASFKRQAERLTLNIGEKPLAPNAPGCNFDQAMFSADSDASPKARWAWLDLSDQFEIELEFALLERAHPAEYAAIEDLRAQAEKAYGDEDEAIKAKALALFQQAQTQLEQVAGDGHTLTLLNLSRMASVLEANNQLPQAIEAQTRVLLLANKRFRAFHPQRAVQGIALGLMLDNAGRFEEAVRVKLAAVAVSEQAYPVEDINTAFARRSLASSYGALGRYGDKWPLQQKVFPILEAFHGASSLKLLGDIEDMADTLSELNRATEALPWRLRAVSLVEKEEGSESPLLDGRVLGLARLYLRMGLPDLAYPHALRALELHERLKGPGAMGMSLRLDYVATILTKQGKIKEAIALFERALSIAEKTQGPESESAITSINNLAEVYRQLSDYGKSLPLIQKASQISEKALGANHPRTGFILMNHAHHLQNMGRFREAAIFAKRALEIAELRSSSHSLYEQGQAEQNTERLINALNRYGTILSGLGDLSQSQVVQERAAKLGESFYGAEHPEFADLLSDLALNYRLQGDYAQAISILQKALGITERRLGPEHPSTGRRLLSLAQAYREAGRLEEARPATVRALAIARKTYGEQNATTAIAINESAMLQRADGKFDEAVAQYQVALAIFEKTNGEDDEGTSNVLNNLAASYGDLGQFDKAIRYYERSLASSERIWGAKHVRTATALSNLGVVLTSVGLLDRAELLFKRAIQITEEQAGAEHPDTGIHLHNLGALQHKRNRFEQALTIFQRSLIISEKTQGPEHPSTASTLSALATIFYDMDRSAEGLGPLDRAIQIRDKRAGSDHPETINARANLSMLLKDLARFDEGLLMGRQNLASAQRSQSELSRFNALRTLAWAHYGSGQKRSAVVLAKLAVNSLQSIRDQARNLDAFAQRGLAEGNQTIYQDLADWLIEAGRFTESEEILNMLKDQELFELVKQTGAGASQVPLRGGEVSLGQSLRALNLEGVSLGSASTVSWRARYLSFLERMEESLTALPAIKEGADEQALNASGSNARGTKAFGTQLKPEQAQNTVALHYVVSGARLSIILSDAQGTQARQIPLKRKELVKQVEAFRVALMNPRIDPRPMGRALYQSLIAPVEPELNRLGAKTLVLTLTDLLRYVPFGALYDGSQYLTQRYALAVHTPAAPASMETPKVGDWKIAALGLTEAVTGFSALPAVREEIEAIVRTKDNAKGLLQGSAAMDAAFDRGELDRALASGFPVMHVASHFQFTPGTEFGSFLVLGNGQRLPLAEIKNLPFQSLQMLVLSACNTASGGGRNEFGAEVEGLGAAVQKAGAKSVLASLWEVSDRSTAQLMQHFYRLRSATSGVSISSLSTSSVSTSSPSSASGVNTSNTSVTSASALQQAQWLLITGQGTIAGSTTVNASESETRGASAAARSGSSTASAAPAFITDPSRPYAHPFYWAPFVLMGNWL
jgi:CHAT domain-containing protein/Tfp pilus assembly protein PilF